MTKPLTFEEYWIQCYKNLPPDNRFHDVFKTVIKNTWNRAMMEAVLVCNNMEEQYEESCILDKDVILDIAVEIESLKSE
jgi:ssDNA-specific exonuclease RecJ